MSSAGTNPTSFLKELRSTRNKPLLLSVMSVVLLVQGILGIATCVIALSSSGASFGMAGMQIPRAEFLSRILPALLAGSIVDLVAGYGIIAETRWSRGLAAVSQFVGLVVLLALWNPFAGGAAFGSIVRSLVWCLIPVWICYGYKPVRAYYDRLHGNPRSA